MAKNDNLKDFVKGLADAIRAKKGTTDLINPQNFETEIASIPSGGVCNKYGYNGHVDEAGLRELGWNDNDIAWLQDHCWWNAEDDDYWKVTEANKQYGPNGLKRITHANINNFRHETDLRFFPKLETYMPSIVQFTSPIVAVPTDGLIQTTENYQFYDMKNCRSVGDLQGIHFNNKYTLYMMPLVMDWGHPETFTYAQGVVSGSLVTFNTMEIDSGGHFLSPGGDRIMEKNSIYRVKEIKGMERWDVSQITSLSGLFLYTPYLKIGDLSLWDVRNVTNLKQMFDYCQGLSDASWFGSWVLNPSANVYLMFRNTLVHTISLPDLPSTIVNSNYLFYGMNLLRNIVSSGTISCAIDISFSEKLTRESVLVVFNALDASHPNTIKLSSKTKGLLSDDDKAIATSKGWTIA